MSGHATTWGRRAIAVALVLAVATVPAVPLAAPAEAAQDCTALRLSGPDRIRTATAISRDVRDRADTVVVARADAYPDALAAVPLAHASDAPLLLTDGDGLSDATATEIQRLGATRAIVLGGGGAIDDAVVVELEELGLTTRRLAGRSRFDTAATVARHLPSPPTEAVLVEGANADPGRGWPDAVVAGPLAAAAGAPVLMVTADGVPAETAAVLAELDIDRLTVVGGTVSVSHDVLVSLADPDGDGDWDRRVERVSGRDRYATSAEVAWEQHDDRARPTSLWLATGRAFPDALAAGAAAAASGGAVLLVDGQRSLVEEPAAALRRDMRGALDRVVVAGGSVAIADPVLDAARDWMCSGRVPAVDLGGDGLSCRPGGSAMHRRVAPSAGLADAYDAYLADPSPATGLAVLRRAGTFTRHMVGESSLRADLERWFPLAGLQGAYHETLHHWQHAGAGSFAGLTVSCLALDRDLRGVLGIDLPSGGPPPGVIADRLRARAHALFPADSFLRDSIDSTIDVYLDCGDGAGCASSNTHVASLLGEVHAYVAGYELQWALVQAGAIPEPDPTDGSMSTDGGLAVIPGTALYLDHLATHAPAAYDEFVQLNGEALAQLWRMYERNYQGPFADDTGDVWEFVFGGGVPQVIAEATSARAGVETPPKPAS